MLLIHHLIKDLQNKMILAYPNVKLWLINKIKVKCLQFGQEVSDIF